MKTTSKTEFELIFEHHRRLVTHYYTHYRAHKDYSRRIINSSQYLTTEEKQVFETETVIGIAVNAISNENQQDCDENREARGRKRARSEEKDDFSNCMTGPIDIVRHVWTEKLYNLSVATKILTTLDRQRSATRTT